MLRRRCDGDVNDDGSRRTEELAAQVLQPGSALGDIVMARQPRLWRVEHGEDEGGTGVPTR